MNKEEFKNEKLYQATMHIVRKMISENTISKEDYLRIDKIFIEKYHPVFGTLLSGNDLINQP